MKFKLSQLFYYAMPAALAVFIFTQTILPVLSKAGDQEKHQAGHVRNRKPATSVSETSVKKVEPALSEAPDGIYYTYKKDYSCKKAGTDKYTPSYSDSYSVVGGQICNLGDACKDNTTTACSYRLPVGMEFTKDYAGLIYKNQKFNRQPTSIPESCVMPACATPSDNCRFDEMPPLDEKGCPQGCGTIICKPELEQCPMLNCAAPPQNCYYDGSAPLDSKGCALGCGNLICDTISSKEFKCPALNCPKPPESCSYDNSAERDKNGCKTSCGELKCKLVNPKMEICENEPVCAEPPAGCYYVGTPAIDDKACRIGCGSMVCKKNTPAKCEQPQCEPPPENCRYDGNSPLDFKGCSTGCGNLVCNSEIPL
jgi:hypothetical protein